MPLPAPGTMCTTTLTLIALVAQNSVIGRSGDLAWRGRNDFQLRLVLTPPQPIFAADLPSDDIIAL